MTAPQDLVAAIRAHDGLYQVVGRLDDLTTDGDAIVTLLAATTRLLAIEGYGVVTFCLSEGALAYADSLPDEDQRSLTAALQRHNLRGRQPLAPSITSLISLLRESLKVVVIVLDAANCFPAAERAFLSEEQLSLREQVARLGSALWLQKNGNAFVLVAEAGSLDSTIERAATRVRLAPPDRAQKAAFLEAVQSRYPDARFDGITTREAARLSSGTTNRATEALIRRAHYTNTPITPRQLTHQKQEALLEQTHGVLRLLDTTSLPPLAGDYVQPTLQLLTEACAALVRGDQNLSPMLVLHGPPGVGKTLAAKHAAATAHVLVLELQSLRASLVGEAEERSRTFHEKRLDASLVPNLLLADEGAHITTSREGNDGGVTAALFGDWLSALADPRYRGRSLIIVTTNVPERLPTALQSRCQFHPVFSVSVYDLAVILEQRCAALGLDIDSEHCHGAAAEIASKGGSPRDLDRMMRRVALRNPHPTWDDVLGASRDLLVPDSQWQAAVYCDYWSLLTMSDRSSIPWHDRAAMPAHLAAVIDENGAIDYDQVRARLAELRHVRV